MSWTVAAASSATGEPHSATGEPHSATGEPHSATGEPRHRHEVLLYSDRDEFLEVTLGFIGDALADGEPIFVILEDEKNAELCSHLDDRSSPAVFADMDEIGRNPARIIPTWIDFLNDNPAPGVRARGIGEPIGPGESPARLAECQRHEALLNVALADSTLWLLCPYDTSVLGPEIIQEARRTHPIVNEKGSSRISECYAGTDAFCTPWRSALPDPPPDAPVLSFGDGDLPLLRGHMSEVAERAGMVAARREDLVLAANEIATNSLLHGGGSGTLRSWSDAGSVICEIRDAGAIVDPLAGRRRPSVSDDGGRGLWLANQLCDLVQIRCYDDGNAVRLHVGIG